MLRTVLRAKIHRAPVTQCDLNYEGSITIDKDLLEAADIAVNERVQVLNINSGNRIETYAIEGERGSKIIGINGAAARQFQKDDLVIICAYGIIDDAIEDISKVEPKIVLI